MRLAFTLFIYFLLVPGSVFAQSLDRYASNLKSLIEKNIHEGAVSYDHAETKSLEQEVSVDELLEITKPWLKSNVINGRNISAHFLSWALQKKTITQVERVKLVEALCINLLTDARGVIIVRNILVLQHAADFSENAKKAIVSLFPASFEYSDCARLAAVAQVKELIPELWKLVKKDVSNLDRASIDVLASLARLGEAKAGELLCQFFELEKSKPNPQGVVICYYVTYSREFAFSLERAVFNCLREEFINMDFSIKDTSSHYFWYPSMYLGQHLASMIKNYPDPNKFSIDIHKLKDWLLRNPNPQLSEK